MRLDDARAVSAGSLLPEVRAVIARFVRANPAALDVAAAWVLHTHAIGAADATPYLHVTGPSKRCGKTRFLEVLRLLAARPLPTANATPAAIFRALDADPPPTLFVDEADVVFRRDANGNGDDIRSLLNAGSRRGTPALRCVGKGANLRVHPFKVFGPKALAGIGDLPADTLADRCLRIRLDRLAPGQRVERLLESRPPAGIAELREALERWGAAASDRLRQLDPHVLEELDDRAADACLALFAIADDAGGEWPRRIRDACVALRRGDDGEPDPGTRLLDALERLFAERGYPASISTSDIVAALAADPDAPGGFDPLNPGGSGRRLAKTLRRYGVNNRYVWVAGGSARGYRWAELEPVIRLYGRPKRGERENPHGAWENGLTLCDGEGGLLTHSHEAESRMAPGISHLPRFEPADMRDAASARRSAEQAAEALTRAAALAAPLDERFAERLLGVAARVDRVGRALAAREGDGG